MTMVTILETILPPTTTLRDPTTIPTTILAPRTNLPELKIQVTPRPTTKEEEERKIIGDLYRDSDEKRRRTGRERRRNTSKSRDD
jgi:hypothetical protein